MQDQKRYRILLDRHNKCICNLSLSLPFFAGLCQDTFHIHGLSVAPRAGYIRYTGDLVVTAKRKEEIEALVPTVRTFSYVDAAIWNWCLKRHRNKSKAWVRRRYFIVANRTWKFFAKVPSHSGEHSSIFLLNCFNRQATS